MTTSNLVNLVTLRSNLLLLNSQANIKSMKTKLDKGLVVIFSTGLSSLVEIIEIQDCLPWDINKKRRRSGQGSKRERETGHIYLLFYI